MRYCSRIIQSKTIHHLNISVAGGAHFLNNVWSLFQLANAIMFAGCPFEHRGSKTVHAFVSITKGIQHAQKHATEYGMVVIISNSLVFRKRKRTWLFVYRTIKKNNLGEENHRITLKSLSLSGLSSRALRCAQISTDLSPSLEWWWMMIDCWSTCRARWLLGTKRQSFGRIWHAIHTLLTFEYSRSTHFGKNISEK